MPVKAYFEDIQDEIIRLLRSSRESVKVCVAWINGQIYAPIFNELASRGVQIQVIYNNDHTNLNHGIPPSEIYSLFPVDTRLSSAIMHNKFCIIDDETVITGSYNWSQKAGMSFENISVITQEYELVKSYLHEFHDLLAYYHAFSTSQLTYCSCRSHSYNLAILGTESGKYDESKIDTWSLCVKNSHAHHYGEEYEHHLQTHLGMKDTPDWREYGYDKASMLGEFQMERNQINSLQNYFNTREGMKINAVGVVGMYNEMAHIEYGEEPIYCIGIIWRDMYYRKIIPEILFDDGYGGINSIVSEHV
jgi:phosphatidylserine/phosphatidylglycerophosphate/cardiolipin synthase-like enzyme